MNIKGRAMCAFSKRYQRDAYESPTAINSNRVCTRGKGKIISYHVKKCLAIYTRRISSSHTKESLLFIYDARIFYDLMQSDDVAQDDNRERCECGERSFQFFQRTILIASPDCYALL